MLTLKSHLTISLFLFSLSLLSRDIQSIRIPRPDESEILGYFHKPSHCEQFPIMIVCQGSYVSKQTLQSCKPLFDKIVKNFGDISLGILAIEKRGSYQDRCDLIEFNAYNTVSNRISDNLIAIQGLPKIIDGWNGRLILTGGSEGTYVASELAKELQESVKALILFAGGGYHSYKEELITTFLCQPWYVRWYIRWCTGTEQEIRKQFQIMHSEPTPTNMWAGQTYRYWADIQERSLAGILELKMPIYYMKGCKDDNFSSSKALQSAYQQNNHITFVWYTGMGHDMGNSFDTVMQNAKTWLKLQILTI